MYPKLTIQHLFKTERLSVQQLHDQDFDKFHEMQSDNEVMIYASGEVQDLEENKKDFANCIDSYAKEKNAFWIWAIHDQKNNFLGTIALVKDKEANWEIGYRLLKSEWGKGYATEAVLGLIEFANDVEEIQNLVAYVDLRNPASQSVLNKTGFVNLGIKYNDTEDAEEYIYSINTSL